MKDAFRAAHYFHGPLRLPAVSEFHRLDPTADARFLRAGVADPVTGVPFRPTNTVVMCATCGLVSLRETWEAVGGCPNGHDTPAEWDVDAALAAGDGAAGARPSVQPAGQPPAAASETSASETSSRSFPVLLAVLAVAALVVGGIVGVGLFSEDEEAPVEVVETEPAEPSGPEAVSVEAGTVEGTLAEGDFLTESGRYQDLYTFAADSSGRVLAFSVSSEDFYPDLFVETPEGERIEAETISEDEGDGTRTVAVRSLRGPGLYRVFLSSRRPNDTGAYALTIRQEDPVRPLAANGDPFAAELGAFSTRADGFFRDRYTFDGVEGREHVVTVRSSAFAPTITVTGPGGGAVEGESGRAGGSATFTFTPASEGRYALVVSSQEARQRGGYTVQLAVAEEPEEQPGEPIATNGRAAGGTLEAGDTQVFSFPGRVGDRVRIEVRAEGFAPSLTLVGPDGTRVPAAPDGDRARIRTTLPSTGPHRILIGATGGGGEYRVTVESEAAVAADDIPRMPGADLRRAPAPSGNTPPNQEYQPQPIGGDGQ